MSNKSHVGRKAIPMSFRPLKFHRAGLMILLLHCTAMQVQAAPPNPSDSTWRQNQVTVSGTVTDDKGAPLAGVSVKVKGTGIGTSTNSSGSFSLKCEESATLEFSSIGFALKELPAKAAASGSVSVMLFSSASTLSEVVAVGYGTAGKKEFTGSIATISGNSVKEAPVQSFDQALAGRAAGVNITQPNGVLNNAPVIRIRGINSISLSSYPLVVVDGVPINTGEVSASANVTNNPLSGINPSDIESISVLKDAASTSIYGSRAAAGVLLITTKKGKSGKAKVTYDGWVSLSKPMRLPKLLNAEQYMMLKNEAVLNAKILGGNANNPNVASELFFPTYNQDGSIVNTNWYDQVYQDAVSHNHSLSVSGGLEATTYFFSMNYSDQNGFIKTNNFKRKSARFNLNHKATSWLSLGANMSYNNSFNASPNTGSLNGNAFQITGLARLALLTSPNVYARNPDGTYNLSTTNTMGMGNNRIVSNFYNPLPLLDLDSYTSENDQLLGTFSATAKLLPGLEAKTSYGIDMLKVENKTFNSPVHGPGYSDRGIATNALTHLNSWNWINTLTYQAKLARNHNLSALLGYDVQSYHNSRWGATRSGASDPFFNEFEGSFGRIQPITNTVIADKAYASVFSRLTYDFKKRYFFTVNFRRDGNSALGADKKYGNFGGVSGGWTLSQEEFFQKSKLANVVNNARLRASWGRVGNGNLSNPFASLMLYSSSLYGAAPTWNFSQAGNPNLGWETSDQTNVGIDLGLFNDRIQMEATYFKNNINGLILSAPQSPSKGIPGNAILENVGAMYNKGFEFAISGAVLRNRKLSWNTSFNITLIKNRVTELAGGGLDIVGTTSTAAETTNITRLGYSVGSLFGAKTAGVNPENGQRIFINKAGQKVQYSHVVAPGQSRWTYLDGTAAAPITAEDFGVLGNALPTWYGGFNNNFNYGNFDLSASITYSGGNYVQNGTRGTLRDQRFWNNGVIALERWTAKGQVTDMPRVVYGDLLSNGSSWPIAANVERGDFLKMKSISLGYRIPVEKIAQSGIASIRVYAQVFNAFILTNYTGSDPEISSNGNSNLTPGVDKNSAPQGRTYTLGLNIGF
ncbi:TonB-linked outer membrane protein, SusC/RagA family [Cnuella takakiae]|uniref:TonB-linked outer membrane protein, SusC/RagA family n=1 Tax=Cnuella takakiae TaxID=1302690 RepID=A0A1M5DXS9_9BACT|nr:TonB-dependent receptor [Cnuella takakiae]SHF71838.1 TonB-linked outer membrane protein, SusC/RagA family [Cnuella takakiae]